MINITKKKVDNSKINIDKNIKINTDDKNETYKCWCCGKSYSKLQSNFIATNFPLYKHYGYYPICKKCTDLFFIEIKDFFDGSEEKAVEHICMMYGLYFHSTPLLAALKAGGYKTKISTYVSNIQLNPWSGKNWLDTLKEGYKQKVESVENANNEQNKSIITPEMKTFWGVGYDEKEYLILQGYYEGYMKTYENDPDLKTQKMMKILSLTEYQIQKNMQSGKDIGTLANSYKSQLSELEVDTANVANDAFGKWLFDIEKYCPADLYLDKKKYHDFFGIGEYIERFLFRPLKNLLFNTKEPEKEYWLEEDTITTEPFKNA